MNNSPHWSEDVVAHGLGGLPRFNGFYHENFLAEHDGVKYLIRVVREQWEDLDFRMLDESKLLSFLNAHDFPAPKLLYQSNAQNYSVHGYISGTPLNALYPKHKALSPAFVESMADLMASVHALPTDGLDECAIGPVPKDGNEFLAQVLDYVRKFYRTSWNEAPEAFAEYDFPNDPFASFDKYVGKMSPRQLVLCHSDVHQHNIMLADNGDKLFLLDWELAVIGDRLYDVALCASRSYMPAPQIDELMFHYLKTLPAGFSELTLRTELNVYLNIEYIRKAISDVYRLHKAMLRSGVGDHQDIKYKREVRLPDLLTKARKIWDGQ